MILFLAIALFLLHALEHEKQLISRWLYNIFESEPIPTPTSIPASRLCTDHPVKKMTTKDEIRSWLLSNCPKSLPSEMFSHFFLNDDWCVRYNPMASNEMSLAELKAIAQHFEIEIFEKKTLKATWCEAIAQKESEYLADFWNWSDSLARSLKPLQAA